MNNFLFPFIECNTYIYERNPTMKILKKILPLICLFLFLSFPKITMEGTRNGLLLWYQNLLPAMLPFIIICGIILVNNCENLFCLPFYPIYCKKKFHKSLPFLFFIGFFCGYPLGAKILKDLYDNGNFSKSFANFLLPFISNISPMFLLGYFYVSLLQEQTPATTILFIFYLPIFTLLLLSYPMYRLFHKNTTKSFEIQTHKKNNSSLDAVILESFEIMIKICGYIVLFSIMILLGNHLFPNQKATLSCCFLEVTTGLKNIISLSFVETDKRHALAFALLNFGGICSIFQVKSVTSKDFSLIWYIAAKGLLSFFTYHLALFLL